MPTYSGYWHRQSLLAAFFRVFLPPFFPCLRLTLSFIKSPLNGMVWFVTATTKLQRDLCYFVRELRRCRQEGLINHFVLAAKMHTLRH